MRTIIHPLSGATYDRRADGRVEVVSRNGDVGVFDAHGTWVSGALRQADPHLCLWIGGRELPTRSRHVAESPGRDDGAIPEEETTR